VIERSRENRRSGRISRWWSGLDEGAWIYETRIPGDWILGASTPFVLVGATLAVTGKWVGATVVWLLGGAVLVAGMLVVSRNVPRAYRDEAYGRRMLKAEVVLWLVIAATSVLVSIVLLIVVVLIPSPRAENGRL
jgi:hypothetical protein